ncbi:hypothetical protein PanWU01x14_361620 [Parasponia andersonii]|uniref:Uncharacterized protein n=1 Tax=Parasponia andersonii TaxID=3476 RepID=A0A2P5A792_PARAD|nr:hypothetical protein PanWU01x14_361620 [Parasponia andersonii]
MEFLLFVTGSTAPYSSVLFRLSKNSRECGKMCFKAENYSSEIDELVAPLGLPFFVYDEIGHITRSPYQLCAQIHDAARNPREHIFSKHDVCEDG